MPKPSTSPYLFDELRTISITKLKEWDYLKLNDYKRGVITWSTNGVEDSSLSIYVDAYNTVTLDYSCEGKSYNYDIPVVALPSNLGKGKVWYFLCAYTGARCIKLHLIDGKFIHRSALKSGMYSKQTQSKRWRQMDRIFGSCIEEENLHNQLNVKHFKRYYNGKPTKRYLKLIEQIKKAERFSVSDIERLL